MAISDKTRKMLWARSGNRCAICHRELVMSTNNCLDDETVIGDECHIVAREPNGARGDFSLPTDERDKYDNLILLCKIDHKRIDDQPNTYTVERLRTIKLAHEKWVQATLASKSNIPKQGKEPFAVPRIETGQQLLQALTGSHAYSFNNDNLENECEVDLVGDFLQNLQDYIDLWDDLESKERIRAQLEMGEHIRNLEANGFLVYGLQRKERIKFGDRIEDNWLVAYVFVVRTSNPLVTKKHEKAGDLVGGSSQPSNKFATFILVKHS